MIAGLLASAMYTFQAFVQEKGKRLIFVLTKADGPHVHTEGRRRAQPERMLSYLGFAKLPLYQVGSFSVVLLSSAVR